MLNQSTMHQRRVKLFLAWIILALLLLIGFIWSLFVGISDVNLKSILQQWLSGHTTKEWMIFETIRLPRAVLGAIIGANLAVAGALMQAVTRNPLASPQVFGINAGASLVVVASLIYLPGMGKSNLVYFAFAGAIIAGFIVFTFASSRRMTNVKLALVGMAIHLLLSSITQGLIISNEQISNVLFWLSGAISGASWTDVIVVFPWSVAGIALALYLSHSLSIFRLGEEVAMGLGQKISRVRILSCIAIVILGGSSVAVAGAVGFVGLMVPHIARRMVGEDYRLVVPISAFFGAILLTYADVLSRFIAYPYESPVGIVTSLLGTPFFLYLARRKSKEG